MNFDRVKEGKGEKEEEIRHLNVGLQDETSKGSQ